MERIKVGNKYIAEKYTDQYGKVYIRLKYNEKMMQLMKKYGLTENDINKIDESGDIDEMMNSALNNVIDELDTQQNDSDSPNEIENFG